MDQPKGSDDLRKLKKQNQQEIPKEGQVKTENENQEVREESWWSASEEPVSGYGTYQRQTIQLNCNLTLDIDCVERLTPLDVMNLYNGVQDTTGNKLWMGAQLFILAFVSSNSKKRIDEKAHILELGCGTGASGLAILKTWPKTIKLDFTDSDHGALALCKRNAILNLGEIPSRVRIFRLDWGNQNHCNGDNNLPEYETVIATDVLYDLSALKPLMETAAITLKSGGVFILSHVPRAAVPGKLVGHASELESIICDEAATHHMRLIETTRPHDLLKYHEDRLQELKDMEEAGAAILTFQKQ